MPRLAPQNKRLTGPQKQDFCNALVDAYSTPVALDQMLQFYLNRRLSDLSLENDMPDIAFKVINEAEDDAWSRELLEAALARSPNNPALKEFSRQFEKAPPVPTGSVQPVPPPPPPAPPPRPWPWLLIAALAISIIIVIGLIRLIPEPGASQTPTPAPPTATVEAPASPTQMVLPDNVTITEKGAIVTKPIFMELVRIPAGEFLMGSDPAKDSQAHDNEKPQHRVALAEFYIGKYEVTNEQYVAFLESTGHSAPADLQEGIIHTEKEYPVVNVPLGDAEKFTQWLSSSTRPMAFRLCTEAEWEKACRGENGRIYPWGDTADLRRTNVISSNIGTTVPARSYLPDGESPYGVANMAGNVWEWVADWYVADYYELSPTNVPHNNPQGPAPPGQYGHHVRRGGAFSYPVENARCAARSSAAPVPPYPYIDLGLRVCAEMPQE